MRGFGPKDNQWWRNVQAAEVGAAVKAAEAELARLEASVRQEVESVLAAVAKAGLRRDQVRGMGAGWRGRNRVGGCGGGRMGWRVGGCTSGWVG